MPDIEGLQVRLHNRRVRLYRRPEEIGGGWEINTRRLATDEERQEGKRVLLTTISFSPQAMRAIFAMYMELGGFEDRVDPKG